MGCVVGKASSADERDPGPQVFSPGLRQPSKETNFRTELEGQVSDALTETLSTLRAKVALTMNGTASGPSLQPAIEEYIPVLLGLTKSDALDTAVSFSWKNCLDREGETELRSARYELASLLQAMAVAYVEDADRALQGDTEAGLAEMRAALSALLTAAGILQQSIGSVLPNEMDVHTRTKLPADVTPGALKALFRQCLAQAAELQMQLDRSKEDVPPAVRKDLACEAVVHWDEAREALKTIPTGGPPLSKWSAYIKWRQGLAKAVAYHQEGLVLNEAEDKGTHGKAVKALKTAEELLRENEALLKAFSEQEPATRHTAPTPLIKDLRERLPKDLGKIARFNTNVFYEKEPDETPELPKPVLSIKPERYVLPETDKVWGSSSSGNNGGGSAIQPAAASSAILTPIVSQEAVPTVSSVKQETGLETRPELVAAS